MNNFKFGRGFEELTSLVYIHDENVNQPIRGGLMVYGEDLYDLINRIATERASEAVMTHILDRHVIYPE